MTPARKKGARKRADEAPDDTNGKPPTMITGPDYPDTAIEQRKNAGEPVPTDYLEDETDG